MRFHREKWNAPDGIGLSHLFKAGSFGALVVICTLALHAVRFADHTGLAEAGMVGGLAAAAGLIALLALLAQRRTIQRQGQEMLIEAVEALSEGFALYDADDRLVICNRKYREIYNCTSKTLVPGARFEDVVRQAAIHDRFFVGGEDIEAFVARRCREHRNPGLPTEQRLAGGRWVQVSERRTRQGGTVGVRTDITALKRAEAMMRDAMETAERANRAKSRFLAAASHDLRQPLHAMGMFVGALAERARGREAGEIIGSLRTTLGALENMLNALLDISKLDAGVTEPAVAEVPLLPLLNRLHAEFRPQARAKGLDFRMVECSASVRSDPVLLESLIRNLLSNALRYTVAGKVVLGCRRRGSGIELEVWDTGIGIAPGQMGEIFQEFQRLDQSAAPGSEGAGLGLAIVERTAKLLGHRLTVRSEVGRGSLFGVTLPLLRRRAAAAAALEGPRAEPGPGPLGGSTLLVIDDNQAVLEGMRRLLTGWGCQVLTATSGEQALAQLDGGPPPDLLIADYRLQAGTGIEAIARLRQTIGALVPAILITGDAALARHGERIEGGLPVLLKPVQPAKLRALLSFTLTQSTLTVPAAPAAPAAPAVRWRAGP